jgi:hypothetical protein
MDASGTRHLYGSDAIPSSYTSWLKPQALVDAIAGLTDEMDLTLECIRRHHAGGPVSPLADVLKAHADFFRLFHGFREFVDFFVLKDLVTPDYDKVLFFLPLDNFERPGIPATTAEYVTYREATLVFICRRTRRMAKWIREHHPDTDVRE